VSAPELAPRLLEHLRDELGEPRLGYAEPPTAISGGYDTRVFGLRLAGATGAWSQRLILRLFGPQHDPARAERERAIQNTVAGLGYPAPRVLAAALEPGVLGGAFLVMERLPGRPLLEARWTGLASILVRAQLALHALDAGPLLDAVTRAAGRDAVTFDGLLVRFGERITQPPLDGLRSAMDWLIARRPRAAQCGVICHGDFHSQNILLERGAVSGVLDWPNALVADPAYDVASTRVILGLVPVDVLAATAPFRAAVRLARSLILARYLAGYRRERPVDPGTLAYYEAVSCMRQMLRVAENRSSAASRAALNPLDASSFGERLSARFARLTGITPTLPRVNV